jgi:hypothetical protein
MIVGSSAATFVPRGRHALKGVPGDWDLFAVVDTASSP